MVCFALLGVLVALTAVQGQYTQTFTIGTNATLLCSFKSLEDPSLIETVKWFQKGKRLRTNPRYLYSSDGLDYTLTIIGVTKKDKGKYLCSPKTVVDMEVADGSFTIKVQKARLPNPPPASQLTLPQHGSGQINCNFAAGKDAYIGMELYWTRDGERFETGDQVLRESESTYRTFTDENGVDHLALENVQGDIAGAYSCNYQYPDGQVFSMIFNISVRELVGPKDVERVINFKEDYLSGSLSCDLSGLGNTTINRFYWEREGEEISSNDTKYEMTENGNSKRLEILDINESDNGIYRCVAELQYYPIAVRFTVTVEPSTKDEDFEDWSEFSVCDTAGKKYRFRVCTSENCLERYGYVYEVDAEQC